MIKMTLSFIEMLSAGGVGSLRIGMSFDQATKLLGGPQDVSTGTPTIYKYGDLELTSYEGNVSMIALHFVGTPNHLPFSFCDLAPDANISFEWVCKMLAEAGIKYAVDETLTFDDQISLKMENSQVILIFANKVLRSVFID
jgi:hypothetical protein